MWSMAVTTTPRLGLPTYSAGSDPHPGRTDHNSRMTQLDALVALAKQGTTAERPAAKTWGRLYWDTTVSRLYWDTGTAWAEVSTVGGGGAGAALAIGGSGSEGASSRAARADHTHPLPLATASAPGAMSAADKAALAGATSAATASTLAMRDAAGRLQVGTPAGTGDAAPKSYVDAQVGTRAPASHTHAWADVTGKPSTFAPAAHTHAWADVTGVPATFTPSAHTHTAADVASGTLDPDRLPVATPAAAGAMPAALFSRLNGATSAATAGALALRDSAGRVQAATPAAAADVATKSYVDAATSNIAGEGHTHAAADLVSGVLDPARLPAATSAQQGALSASLFSRLNGATAAATANSLAMRDAAGRVQVAEPSAAGDAATKAYVDAKAGASSSVPWSGITGVPADLANRTTTATPSTVVTRSSAGYFDVRDPSAPAHPASKSYVDQSVSAVDRITAPNGADYAAVTNTYLGYRASGAWKFAVNNDGSIYIGTIPWSSVTGKPSTFTPSSHTHSAEDLTSGTVPYQRVRGTTGPANYAVSGGGTYHSVWVDGDGRFGRNTSSRRYKGREAAWDGDGSGVLSLQPVTYVRRNEDGTLPEGEDVPREFGLIAEDVAEHLPEVIVRDPDGVVDGVRYDLLPVAMIPLLQDLAARVAKLEGAARA